MNAIHSRASWGARHADGVGNRPVGNLEVYLHHSVTKQLPVDATVEEERVQIRVVEGIGQQRFGRGMSYTFLIPPSGRIYQGVSPHRISYHSGGGRDGKPRNTLGAAICLVGNTDANEMTPQQADAIVWLLRHGVDDVGLWPVAEITEGHRDFKQTACPGGHAYSLIGDINRRARQGSVKPTTTPALEEDDMKDLLLIRNRDNGQTFLRVGTKRVDVRDTKEAASYRDAGVNQVDVTPESYAQWREVLA